MGGRQMVSGPSQITHWQALSNRIERMWSIYLDARAGDHIAITGMPEGMLRGIYPGYRDVELLQTFICNALAQLDLVQLEHRLTQLGALLENHMAQLSHFQRAWIQLGNINPMSSLPEAVYQRAARVGREAALQEYLRVLQLVRWFQAAQENPDYIRFFRDEDWHILAQLDLEGMMRVTLEILDLQERVTHLVLTY